MNDETSIADGVKQLINNGVKSLEIYWLEDIADSDDCWWVDVHEDNLCDVCEIGWVWDVLSQAQVDTNDSLDDYFGSLDTDIIVDEPFSEDVVKDAVVGWLKSRYLDIAVKVVDPEGKDAMNRLVDMLSDMDDAIPLDEIDDV